MKLKALSDTENEATAQMLLHLAEVDARKLYVPRGFSSLFSYCTGVLRYSEPAASRRICCARALARFPELLELLLKKEISLSSLACAANILSAENLEAVTLGIKGKSYREVQEFVSQYRPVKTMVREEIKPVVLISKPPAAREDSLTMPLFEEKRVKEDAPKERPVQVKVPQGASAPAQPLPEQRYELRFSVKK